MSKNHTPTPWSAENIGKKTECIVVDHIGKFKADPDNEGNFVCELKGPHAAENARRIVACVNACEGIEIEMLEIPGLLKSLVAAGTQELRAELQTLKAVNEAVMLENERMQTEIAQKQLDRSKEHSEWILGKWNEDVKVFDARRKTDAEKARMLLRKWEYVEQPEFRPKLKYARWDALSPKCKFQAYDADGWLIAYENRPWLDAYSIEWRFSGGMFTVLFDEPQDLKAVNWQQTLIERPTQQDNS